MRHLASIAAALIVAMPMAVLAQAPRMGPLPPAPAEKMGPPVGMEDRLTMTEAEAKSWVRKDIYSRDGEHLGEVAAIARDADGHVVELQADIGSFLGLGETRVRITPSQFSLHEDDDRVVLNLTADEARNLPEALD